MVKKTIMLLTILNFVMLFQMTSIAGNIYANVKGKNVLVSPAVDVSNFDTETQKQIAEQIIADNQKPENWTAFGPLGYYVDQSNLAQGIKSKP